MAEAPTDGPDVPGSLGGRCVVADHATPARPARRHVLLGGAALLASVAAGCSTSGPDDGVESSSSTNSSDDSASDTAGGPSGEEPGTGDGEVASGELGPADFDGLATCVMLPEMTAGPFPTLEVLDRRDITEGYPGRPLDLGLRVVDDACAPVPGAAVEVWHADASGDYSSYEDGGTGKDEGEGTTFLRGTQVADADGIVRFTTIYPGWYRGRAVHVHVRARVDGDLVLTSQLFFPDERNGEVLATGPYAEFGEPDTTNETDGLTVDVRTDGTLLAVTDLRDDAEPPLRALANLGVPG